MAKRGFPSSAFALPGLAKDSKKPFGASSARDGFGFSAAHNVSRTNQTNVRGSKLENLNDSSSLVDERGSLLPAKTEHTLENLTKTRPRSPGRRSPSPLARGKFEHDSNLSIEADNNPTPIKDHEDVPAERITSVKERFNASPALILSNDVGLSVSSSELSLTRSSPRMGRNRPEVLPKPDRTRNRENGDVVGEKSVSNATRMLSEPKILSVDKDDHRTFDHDPPPLPTSPPPLEDDEILGSLANDTLNDELKHSFQASGFEKTTKAEAEKTSFDLSTKVGNPIKNRTEVNGLNRPNRQLRDPTISDSTNSNYSSSSRIAKWQGYGRTSSEDSYASGMPKIGPGITKIGSGIIPDRQTSLDSAITTRLSKYETPYNTRQRKPVEKSMSANRRRFKPVTLTDEPEKTGSENAQENLDSSVTVNGANTSTSQLAYERLHGTQTGKNFPDSLHRDHNKEMDVKSQPLSSSWNTREYSFQSSSFMSGDKVKPVPGHSSNMPSVTSSAGNIDKSRQKPASPDLHGVGRTSRPEPAVVVEYDNNDYTEKDSAVESNRKVTSVSSDTRASNKHDSQNNIATSEIKENPINSNDRNSGLANQHGSPGLTLPKVVIEYDGVVVNDPLIDGYDTEETSDEGKKMTSSSIAEAQDSYTMHEDEYMSDGSLHSEYDDVGDYGLNSDEEDEADITLRDDDLAFDQPAKEEVEEKAKGRLVNLVSFKNATFKRLL